MGEMKRPPLRLSASSIKEGIRILFKNPLALFNYMSGGVSFSVEKQCNGLMDKIGADSSDVLQFWHDVQHNLQFNRHIFGKLKDINYGQIYAPELLYALVRKFRPSIVVETGVSAGISSAYMLQAMEDNKYGHVYSIDYPDHTMPEEHYLPKGVESGFAVPPYLRHRWTLCVGKSEELLEPLLAKVGEIDVFVHDSEHSYQNMFLEYSKAWGYIKDKGLLISHDINDNKAFRDFAELHKKEYYEIYFAGIGIIKK